MPAVVVPFDLPMPSKEKLDSEPEVGHRTAAEETQVTLPFSGTAALAAAREILPWMVGIRRELHQHPELGLEEHWTSGRIQEVLEELGIEYVAGLAGLEGSEGTGILGLIRGREEGPCVALRADIDALPLEDAKDVPYRSRIAGCMHACGHDVHTTILLGAARVLAELNGPRKGTGLLAGTVKLIFQPAEETVGGALMLIDEGVLDAPPVDAVFGLHVDASFDVGTFGIRYGQRNASSDSIRLSIYGESSHGAYPAAGVDAIVLTAEVVSALQTIVSRNVDPRKSAVLTFGTIRGGSQANILANRVDLVGTVRTLDPETRKLILRRLRETAEGVAGALGGRAEIEIEPGYDSLVNDDGMVDVAKKSAIAVAGEENVVQIPNASMGVEDFAYYLRRAPGAFFSLGVRNQERGIVHPVHTQKFDVDEEALAFGAAVQVMNALEVLRR